VPFLDNFFWAQNWKKNRQKIGRSRQVNLKFSSFKNLKLKMAKENKRRLWEGQKTR
jgi:hypothetical protein